MIRARLTVLTRLPLTNTLALAQVMPGSLRTRMRKLRRLKHCFADGSLNAFDGEIRAGTVSRPIAPSADGP